MLAIRSATAAGDSQRESRDLALPGIRKKPELWIRVTADKIMNNNRALFVFTLLLIIGLLISPPHVNAKAEEQIVLDEESVIQSGDKYEFQVRDFG